MKAIKPPKAPNNCTPHRQLPNAMNGKSGSQRNRISRSFGHMISQRGFLSPRHYHGDLLAQAKASREKKDNLLASVSTDKMVIHIPCRQATRRHAESMVINMAKKGIKA